MSNIATLTILSRDFKKVEIVGKLSGNILAVFQN